MSAATRCEVCEQEPLWSLTRHGDTIRSWACAEHVSDVLLRLQRVHEVTEVSVRHYPKAVEVAGINRMLRSVAGEAS